MDGRNDYAWSIHLPDDLCNARVVDGLHRWIDREVGGMNTHTDTFNRPEDTIAYLEARVEVLTRQLYLTTKALEMANDELGKCGKTAFHIITATTGGLNEKT